MTDLITNLPAPQRPRQTRRRFASQRSLVALMLREMTTSYGRSPGGYLWAVLEPAAGIALLSWLFSLGLKSPGLGSNFAIFYATGMVPFLMYADLSSKTATSLMYSRKLLEYPTVTYVDAMVARFLLNLLTQLMVSYIIFSAILIYYETRTVMELSVIFQAYCMLPVLAAGVGTLNCFLFTMFPLWQRAWAIFTRPLFFLSCIFFLFETFPAAYRDMLWYNPLVHVVGTMRHAFYPSYEAPYVEPLYVYGFGLVCLVTGLVFLNRYHRFLLNDG